MRNNILDKHLSGMNLTSDSRINVLCYTAICFHFSFTHVVLDSPLALVL